MTKLSYDNHLVYWLCFLVHETMLAVDSLLFSFSGLFIHFFPYVDRSSFLVTLLLGVLFVIGGVV